MRRDRIKTREGIKAFQVIFDALDAKDEEKLPADDFKPFWYDESSEPGVPEGNFGDDLNPELLRHILGREVPRMPTGYNFFGAGSILTRSKAGVHVWGSGLMSPHDKFAVDAVFHAVRGPLTRDLILKAGGICPEIYGDPALLYPRYFNLEVSVVPGRVGFIPHYVHVGVVKYDDPSIYFLDIRRRGREAIEAFVRELKMCESVVSSSLHGVIMAAYGIPAQWVTIPQSEKQLSGNGMKFNDYFLVAGLTPPKKILWPWGKRSRQRR